MKKFLTDTHLILIIILLASILRFWHLGNFPPSLFVDELSNGYNAYSILKTGRDEYGNFLPLTFKSFGDYNPALSVYTLVPAISILGLNDYAVRAPAALFGVGSVIGVYFLTYEIFKRRKVALFSAFLLSISPWHLPFSRYDHEATFMVFYTTLALVAFFNWLNKTTRAAPLVISSIFFGLALNSYHGAKVYVPLLILVLAVVFKRHLFTKAQKLALPLITLFIFTIPYLVNFENTLIRGQSVGILKESAPVATFISGYLSHFSPNFLFISGDSIGRHSVPGMGQLYVFMLPLLVIGLFKLIVEKKERSKFLIMWLLVTPIAAAVASPVPHALRSLPMGTVIVIISALGLYSLSRINSKLKTIGLLILASIAFYNIFTYLHLYYIHYPKEKSLDWSYGYKEVATYVNNVQNNYSQVAIGDDSKKSYIAFLFYTKFDPSLYQPQSSNKAAFDKFEFFGPSWSKTKQGKALIVTPFWQAHPPEVLKNVYLPNGDLRFLISTE